MKAEAPIAGILLAAGMSTRFGAPKQLARLNDKPLLHISLTAALDSGLDRVILVLGHRFDTILKNLAGLRHHPKLMIINNPDYRSGMSTSVKAGLLHVKEPYASAMFLLADQPLVSSSFINHLMACHRQSDKGICLPVKAGRHGNPVIFSRRFFPLLQNITGDKGGRDIINTHPGDILKVPVVSDACTADIDTPQDLEKLSYRSSSSSSET